MIKREDDDGSEVENSRIGSMPAKKGGNKIQSAKRGKN